jgi:hypothetical protein
VQGRCRERDGLTGIEPRQSNLEIAKARVERSPRARPLGTFGAHGDCRCEVTEDDMSQHLTRAQLGRSVFGALFAMFVFVAVLFTSAHHFAG